MPSFSISIHDVLYVMLCLPSIPACGHYPVLDEAEAIVGDVDGERQLGRPHTEVEELGVWPVLGDHTHTGTALGLRAVHVHHVTRLCHLTHTPQAGCCCNIPYSLSIIFFSIALTQPLNLLIFIFNILTRVQVTYTRIE